MSETVSDIKILTQSRDAAAKRKAVHALKQRRYDLEEKSYQLQIDIKSLAAEIVSIDEKIKNQEADLETLEIKGGP